MNKIYKHAFGHKLVYETSPLAVDALKTLHYQTPLMMKAQRDALRTDLGGIDQGLDFTYFEEDQPHLQGQLEQFNNQIDDLSKRLINDPTNVGLSNQLYTLKVQYDKFMGAQGIGGQAKAKYDKAQSDWAEIVKNYKQGTSPGDIQKMKQAFFNERAKSTDEDFLPTFQGGRTSGIYDVRKDIESSMANVKGQLGQLAQAGVPATVVQKRTPDGISYLEIVNSRTGTKVDNSDAILGQTNAIIADYNDPTGQTDRSRYKQVAGISDDYISNMANQIGQAYTRDYYSQAPGQSTNIKVLNTPSGFSEGTSSSSSWFNFLANEELNFDYDLQKEVNKEIDEMDGAFSSEDKMFSPKTKEQQLTEKSSWHPDNIWQDTKEAFSVLDPGYLTKSGDPLFKSKLKESKQQKIWDQRKKDFEPIYTKYQKGLNSDDPEVGLIVNGKKITNDQDYWNYTTGIKQKYTAFTNAKLNLSDYDLYNNLMNKVEWPEDGEVFKELDGGDGLNWKEVHELYSDNNIPITKMVGWMNSNGDIEVQIPDKKGRSKKYIVQGLPYNKSSDALKQTLKDVDAFFKDYTWLNVEVEAQNNVIDINSNAGFMPVSNNLKLKGYVNPSDTSEKVLYLYGRVPLKDAYGVETGEYAWRQSPTPITKSELYQIAAFGEATMLNKKFK